MKRVRRDAGSPPPLFPSAAFSGFGPSRFRPTEEAVVGRCLCGNRSSQLKRGVRDHAPRRPGVYGMINAHGRIVYIGKAKNLRARLLSYFRVKSRDPKAGKIVGHARMLAWEETGDEFAALLRELELIQRLRPRFNVLGLPGYSRHHYLCIGKSPAPYAYIAKQPTGKESGSYGPLRARRHTEDAVRRLNDWYRLRDCPNSTPMAFSDQTELFPLERAPKCLRFELGACLGPCVGSCTRQQYRTAVSRMKAFLDGRDPSPLATLQRMMEHAAARFEFEKASTLRDRLQSLQWLDDRLAMLRKARTMDSFVYPLIGEDQRERWYVLHHGQVRIVLAAPQSEADERQARKTIHAILKGECTTVLGEELADSVLLVVAWFRKNSGERERLRNASELVNA